MEIQHSQMGRRSLAPGLPTGPQADRSHRPPPAQHPGALSDPCCNDGRCDRCYTVPSPCRGLPLPRRPGDPDTGVSVHTLHADRGEVAPAWAVILAPWITKIMRHSEMNEGCLMLDRDCFFFSRRQLFCHKLYNDIKLFFVFRVVFFSIGK